MPSYAKEGLHTWCVPVSYRFGRGAAHVNLSRPSPYVKECVFHGLLPPSPSEGCHSVHVNAATQSTGLLPPSPRERCHVDHGKVATHARRSLPPSEQRDAGSLLLV